jgi:feruloyl esterase
MRRIALTLVMATSLAPGLAHAERGFECARLKALKVAAVSIGLPTKGAVVTAAESVPGASTAVPMAAMAHGDYCLVTGTILSIDPGAQNIHFQVALPDNWNKKALMLGGGGFNGVIPAVAGNLRNVPANAQTPLARGYAVFASDSGHQVPASAAPPPFGRDAGAFLTNEEQLRNYLGDALKKTRELLPW